MSVSAIIGASGFIGSRLKWYADNFLDEEWIGITRENYRRWKGYRFNKLVWAAGSARKDLSSQELIEKNVVSLLDAIQDFPTDKIIYVSSQSVYNNDPEPNEESGVSFQNLSSYGRSKLLGEYVVKNSFLDFVLIRPNGFSGPGLTKNVIFALTRSKPYFYYTPDSYAQYIHVDRFAQILFFLSDCCCSEIVNVAPKTTISPLEIASLLGISSDNIQLLDPPRVQAKINTDKLHTLLAAANYAFPTNVEAVCQWNEPLF